MGKWGNPSLSTKPPIGGQLKVLHLSPSYVQRRAFSKLEATPAGCTLAACAEGKDEVGETERERERERNNDRGE